MAPQKHLRIGVYVPIECQMFDVSPVDLLGMLDPSYLTAAEVPSSLIALGVPSTIEYISLPSTGAHISLTANAFLRVSKTTQDVEVQPGQLDILLVPGPNPATIFEEEPLAFLRGHAEWKGKNGERTDILSVCSGCCLLAQSGILKGKAASGPRPLVPRLRKDFPDTKWVEDKRWVADGNIWSSGGITLGQEMMAAYIREKFPGPVAEAVIAMADVGQKGIDYPTSTTQDNVWWLWQIVKATVWGNGKAKKRA